MKKTNLIYGKIGIGKTKLLFTEVDKMIEKNESLLFLDLKEEYYRNYSSLLKESGYDIIVINLKNPLASNNFNPYKLPYQYYKNGEIDKSLELLESINKRLFSEDNSNVDPFWTKTSADLFSGLSLLTFKEAKEEEVNLGSISLCLDNLNKSDYIEKYLSRLDAIDSIYNLVSTTVYAPDETKGSIVSVTRNKIKPYILKPNLLQLLGSTNFEITKNKTAIFVIPKENDKEINNIANIFINQLVEQIKVQNLNYNLILDNIDFINHLDSLTELINMVYPNINLYIATRSIDSFNKLYGKDMVENILNSIHLTDEDLHPLSIADKSLAYPSLNQEVKYFNVEKYFTEYFSVK